MHRSGPLGPGHHERRGKATGGTFFEASSAEQLDRVYDDIGSRVGYEIERREIGTTFVAIGSLLLVGALGAALVWTGRIL